MVVRTIPLGDVDTGADARLAVPIVPLWFWVKAGIGFGIGVCIVVAIAAALYASVLWPIYLRLVLSSF